MIEPTESESLEELDRFVDAMNSIYEEIMEIKDGKYPKENSGLATISLALFFGAKKILLSGIIFTNKIYEKYQGGKDVVFANIHNNGGKIFSLDGNLAEKISIEEWYRLENT